MAALQPTGGMFHVTSRHGLAEAVMGRNLSKAAIGEHCDTSTGTHVCLLDAPYTIDANNIASSERSGRGARHGREGGIALTDKIEFHATSFDPHSPLGWAG